MIDGKPCPIEPGGEEHGMAEAQKPGIAEGQIVAHRKHAQHQDTREDAPVIFRQQKIERQKQEHDAGMQREAL